MHTVDISTPEPLFLIYDQVATISSLARWRDEEKEEERYDIHLFLFLSLIWKTIPSTPNKREPFLRVCASDKSFGFNWLGIVPFPLNQAMLCTRKISRWFDTAMEKNRNSCTTKSRIDHKGGSGRRRKRGKENVKEKKGEKTKRSDKAVVIIDSPSHEQVHVVWAGGKTTKQRERER